MKGEKKNFMSFNKGVKIKLVKCFLKKLKDLYMATNWEKPREILIIK